MPSRTGRVMALVVALVAALTAPVPASAESGPGDPVVDACAGFGQMVTQAPVYDLGFGPSASGDLSAWLSTGTCVYNTRGAMFVATFGSSMFGNHCELATGQGAMETGNWFSFLWIGEKLLFTGEVEGVLNVHADAVQGQWCGVGARIFLLSGALVMVDGLPDP